MKCNSVLISLVLVTTCILGNSGVFSVSVLAAPSLTSRKGVVLSQKTVFKAIKTLENIQKPETQVSISAQPILDYTLKSKIQASPISKPQVSPSTTHEQPSVSIPALGIQKFPVSYASMRSAETVQKQLAYTPVMESQLTSDSCQKTGNSYLMGHSEPSSKSEIGLSGTRVFENLHTLKNGDNIILVNQQGISCTYQVFDSMEVVTEQDLVSKEVFDNLFFPDTHGQSWLTIQTCKRGSASIRLIVRARRIA
jgi:LPXTG-site transpeptidase (sortase) family protein